MTPKLAITQWHLHLFFSLAQGAIPLWGAHKNNPLLMNFAIPAARFQFFFILLAFVCLTLSFVESDFSVALVAQNSHTLKPLIYKISGVWGNHEGSRCSSDTDLRFGFLVGEFGKNCLSSLRARVLSIQGLIGAGFIAFLLFTSNPFLRLDPSPLQGSGLNPCYKIRVWPSIHLFFIWAMSDFPWLFICDSCSYRGVDPAWARWVRPWTLVAGLLLQSESLSRELVGILRTWLGRLVVLGPC